MKISRQRTNEIEKILMKFLKNNVDYNNPANVGFALQKIVDEVIYDFSAEMMAIKMNKGKINVAFDGSELLDDNDIMEKINSVENTSDLIGVFYEIKAKYNNNKKIRNRLLSTLRDTCFHKGIETNHVIPDENDLLSDETLAGLEWRNMLIKQKRGTRT